MNKKKVSTFLLMVIPLSIASYLQTSYALFSVTPKKQSSKVSSKTAPIDINHADLNELLKLKGVGPKKAKVIIAYRNTHGPFKSINDLTKIKGFNNKTVMRLLIKNKDRLAMGLRRR